MTEMKAIAGIYTPFGSKFGVPRQSGLVEDIKAQIVFEPEFRSADAVRGLEQYSHIWLIWEFSENKDAAWSPTVRPPRLGGNVHMGVFATRSPFRPNPIGLSCVKLDRVEIESERGPVLYVSGADMVSGTPIFDIKPYIPYGDCHPEATGGFTDKTEFKKLTVMLPPSLEAKLSPENAKALVGVLENDPRPSYHDDPERVYGFSFASKEIKFSVCAGILTVREIS